TGNVGSSRVIRQSVTSLMPPSFSQTALRRRIFIVPTSCTLESRCRKFQATTRQRSRIPRREFLQQKIRQQRCGSGKRCAGFAPGSSGQSVYGSDYKMSENRGNSESINALRTDFWFNV